MKSLSDLKQSEKNSAEKDAGIILFDKKKSADKKSSDGKKGPGGK